MARKKAEPKSIEQENEIGMGAEGVPDDSATSEAEMNNPAEEIGSADSAADTGDTSEGAPEQSASESENVSDEAGADENAAGDNEIESGAGDDRAAAAGDVSGETDAAFYEAGLASGDLEHLAGESSAGGGETEQGDMEYGSLLSEVSSMGLNSPDGEAPLTLPEAEPATEDAADSAEGACRS